jgi:two-component system cell cycle sensor histidine kinase/response regulator CckA
MSVYLPQAAAGPAGPAEPAAIPPAPVTDGRPRNATILLVEDEAPVRKVTTDILDRAGFRVLPAASPGEAVALFEEHVDGIDLLLTDIVMPQMHGPTLAGRLVARRPGLPVLFVSGYSDVMPAQPAGMRSVTFLAKPFTPADLVAAVDQLLLEARSA